MTASKSTGTTGDVVAESRRLEHLPLLLSVVAGLTDVTTFVLLHGVFSAHITGNLVVLAADIAAGRAMSLTGLLAIPCFVIAAAVVTAVTTRSSRAATSWAGPLLLVQAGLLTAAAAVGIGFTVSARPDSGIGVLTGLLAVAAMAVQNALLHVVFAHSPTTAVMTGNVVGATVAGVRVLVRRASPVPPAADPDREALRRTWPLIVGFLAGCLVGGGTCYAVADWAAGLPMVAALLTAALYVGRRASGPGLTNSEG